MDYYRRPCCSMCYALFEAYYLRGAVTSDHAQHAAYNFSSLHQGLHRQRQFYGLLNDSAEFTIVKRPLLW